VNNIKEKSVVVTGGSGYIGSNVCRVLVDSGYNVVNIDKSKRNLEGVTQYPFEVDNKQVNGILKLLKPDFVIHIAANNSVPASMDDPATAYTQNVYQTINLLNNCVDAGVKNFIFASSSSVYGTSQWEDNTFKEDDKLEPVNPYGRTKMICEQIIQDYATANDFNFVNLRLFNVAGSANGRYGYQKDPLVHVLPILTRNAMEGEEFCIFGDDYDTEDGSNMRDYTHVSDVARAFLSAINYLDDGNESSTLNIGSSNPISTKQLIDIVAKELDTDITTSIKPRRPGDMVGTFADNTKAKDLLGWQPTFSIEDIVKDEIKWQSSKSKRKSA
jgi:UDP-glucose 4-epimerase